MAAKTVICLDLDGTLVDSSEAHVRSYNFAFHKNNLPSKTYNEIISRFGQTAEHIIQQLFPRLPENKIPAIVTDKIEFFVNSTFKLVKPLPGVSNALKKLKEKYTLALVSNATQPEIAHALKQAKISPRIFAVILGKEKMSPKPSPDAIKKIESAVKSRVEFVVGDTVYDIKMGKNAGKKTIAVLTGANDLRTLGAEKPTMIIKSAAILPQILEGDLWE